MLVAFIHRYTWLSALQLSLDIQKPDTSFRDQNDKRGMAEKTDRVYTMSTIQFAVDNGVVVAKF